MYICKFKQKCYFIMVKNCQVVSPVMTAACCSATVVLYFQYLSEANDVDTWIKEKTAFVSSADYGKDEDASDKLLAKHKVKPRNTARWRNLFAAFRCSTAVSDRASSSRLCCARHLMRYKFTAVNNNYCCRSVLLKYNEINNYCSS